MRLIGSIPAKPTFFSSGLETKKMTKTMKNTPLKPDIRELKYVTLAASLDLIAMVFLATVGGPLLLGFVAACELVLIICAAIAWKKYIDQSIDYKIYEYIKSVESHDGGEGQNR